jgi:hypothetical protein
VNRGDPRLRLVTLALLLGAAFLVVALSGSLSADAVHDCAAQTASSKGRESAVAGA